MSHVGMVRIEGAEVDRENFAKIKQDIEKLGPAEHAVILRVLQSRSAAFTRDRNEAFFDLAALDADTLDAVAAFVRYRVESNLELDAHDAALHKKKDMLRRRLRKIDSVAKKAATRVPASPTQPPCDAPQVLSIPSKKWSGVDGAALGGAPPMAFLRRASDSGRKRP